MICFNARGATAVLEVGMGPGWVEVMRYLFSTGGGPDLEIPEVKWIHPVPDAKVACLRSKGFS